MTSGSAMFAMFVRAGAINMSDLQSYLSIDDSFGLFSEGTILSIASCKDCPIERRLQVSKYAGPQAANQPDHFKACAMTETVCL